ncbi:MAG: glycosyltransferase family 4 protein [Woeseia sp.]
MRSKILYIAPALPVLTCTFIYREIFDLRNLGFQIDAVSMNTPPDDRISDEARGFLDTTLYLDKVPESRKFLAFVKALILHPVSTMRCLKLFATATPMQSFRDYQRLGYHLIEACYLFFRLEGSKPDHIHSHFITGSTSIAMFLSELMKAPFSFTMHASAIWIDPVALSTKLERCRFCVSISEYNKQYVLSQFGDKWQSKINVVHCGISMTGLAQLPRQRPKEDASIGVLAVGQLMKRKGYHVLIEAARILRDKRVNVVWTIVGEGNQRGPLEEMIARYDLHHEVKLMGARPHEEIPQFVADADIFTLPCVIGDDNTRDGIPVALMEAMAWRVPVVSTNIVGLPELIESGHDGILVESDNADALADAIEMLAKSAELRQRIGNAAVTKIEREFNAARSAEQLRDLFDASARASFRQA